MKCQIMRHFMFPKVQVKKLHTEDYILNLNEPVHKLLVLIECVNSERSDEPAQSRQRIRCFHTYNSRWIMPHLRHRNFQFRYI